ncbi:phosphoribosylamine--glycine ligase [Criibacterium bergeronii]|uniref:Phosphoribosylamine--glycine ligase n=1 Tax=Criibacterium bergeronii TaxID=1871336 RepID=A0A371IN32_9FIRM|nr:phosphoribosylamine--glycine ligase [Criibacterium bergeronii]MBS6062541.1 phosphoribosylamine--glycine ligase [Peptostreptococcaceae bacterium]RDY21899.1 phosphoribosylamine--glycine ligase [Criibacterium bergeronii]TRW26823.1 phosphoribosylamine--glycine ligase [Criibacterium bergeronii]
MKIMVVGGGGREHAIIKKINENKLVDKIYSISSNLAFQELAEVVDISVKDIEKVKEFAKTNKVDYAIVSMDDPLVLGMVDELQNAGIKCFGPNKNAAIIEGSKSFSKDLMKKYNIPTASYEVFDDSDSAKEYLKNQQMPIVIKADGLALGKGVIIAQNLNEALDAVDEIMVDKKFGDSGLKVVIEEFLEGPEVTVLSFTDGNIVVPMISSMDHKQAYDGDKGPNTGGMGVIAPNPYYTNNIAKICMDTIFNPTIQAMKKEGRIFKGCLYFGLMLTKNGPKVIEYNCRFGDPEAQTILPLLKSDLLTIMMNVTNEKLSDTDVIFSNAASCCVVMASDGYPISYKKGFEITFDEKIKDNLIYAGTTIKAGKLVTNGGRVLGVVETAENLKTAIDKAYETVSKVHFENAYYRKDIGQKALKVIK